MRPLPHERGGHVAGSHRRRDRRARPVARQHHGHLSRCGARQPPSVKLCLRVGAFPGSSWLSSRPPATLLPETVRAIAVRNWLSSRVAWTPCQGPTLMGWADFEPRLLGERKLLEEPRLLDEPRLWAEFIGFWRSGNRGRGGRSSAQAVGRGQCGDASYRAAVLMACLAAMRHEHQNPR